MTTVRVVPEGVVLRDSHRARLGPHFARAFDAFAAQASAGVYSLVVKGEDELEVVPRAGSRLFDGIPTRLLPSPVLGQVGPLTKQASPSPYDAVRVAGVATLLTDAAGDELLEGDVAALLAWDGAQLVAVPEGRPRIASVAEAAVLTAFDHRRAPVLTAARWDLLLLNAVTSCVPAGSAFPAPLRERLDAVLLATARR